MYSLHCAGHFFRWAELWLRISLLGNIVAFICFVITLSVVKRGPRGQMGLWPLWRKQAFTITERLTHHLSPMRKEYVRLINNSRTEEKKNWWPLLKINYSHNEAVWPLAPYYLYLVSHVMWLLSCGITDNLFSQLSVQQRHLMVVQCSEAAGLIVSSHWQKAMSDKWSEVRCTGEQRLRYHSATGRRTANCNEP